MHGTQSINAIARTHETCISQYIYMLPVTVIMVGRTVFILATCTPGGRAGFVLLNKTKWYSPFRPYYCTCITCNWYVTCSVTFLPYLLSHPSLIHLYGQHLNFQHPLIFLLKHGVTNPFLNISKVKNNFYLDIHIFMCT